MKKILILALSLVSLTSSAQNAFKSIILQNATASDTAATTGRIFYNPTVNRISFIENGVSKHFISSVFGRKASSITAQSGDYNISQITNGLSNSLNAGRLFIGNGSNIATGVALSQDGLLSSSGALTVQGINGTLLSTLPTGILKVTTSTGAVGTALVTDFPTLNQNTTGSAATLSPGRNINGVLFDGSANISINLNNSLSISAELISGGSSSFNGSAAKSIGIQPSSVVNSMLANASITIAGNSQALGTSVTLDQITGISSNGYIKRTGANALTNISSIPNSDLTNSTITIAGNSQALGTSITQDQITGLSSNGIIKRTGANTLGVAVSNTDYQAPITFGTGVQTALGVNLGTSGSFITNGGTASSLNLNTTGTGNTSIGNTTGNFTMTTGIGSTINVTADQEFDIILNAPTSAATFAEFISSDLNTYMGVAERFGVPGAEIGIYNDTPTGSGGIEIRLDVNGNEAPYANGVGGFFVDGRTVKKGFELIDTDGNVITDFSGFVSSTLTPKNYVDGLTLTGSATLDFPNTTTGISDLTISVTNSIAGKPCRVGVPNGSITATANFWCWVSSNGTVTVRFSPKATGGENPASGTFKVYVDK